jgi:RimJ/RimL family protein N-acetyltransferase
MATPFTIPTVETARLRLRAFRAGDLDAYAAMQADPEVMRHLVDGRTHTRAEVWRTMATSLGAWPLRGYGMWACESLEEATFVGSVGIFHPLDWPEPEVAYALDRRFWGRGFATEAAGAARDWLFAQVPLSRVASFIRPQNQASKRVVERLGAVCEGLVELRGTTMEHWVHRRKTSNAPAKPTVEAARRRP